LGALQYDKRKDVSATDSKRKERKAALQETAQFNAPAERKPSKVSQLLEFYKNVGYRFKGFTDTSETINGRLAMLGLIVGFGQELLTGNSLLQQMGIGNAKLMKVLEGVQTGEFTDFSAITGVAEGVAEFALACFFITTLTIFSSKPPTMDDESILGDL
jgi:ferrochelatase